MHFKIPKFKEPNFNEEIFINAPNVTSKEVLIDGVAPNNYHATTIFPEYFKIDDKWLLAKESRMDCVVVIKENNDLEIKEFRRLKIGENVVIGREEDSSSGIFVYVNGFQKGEEIEGTFTFRTGRSRETSYSRDYDRLYELLKHERDNGYIVWVLGPAVVFDSDSRKAMQSLIEHKYVNAILAGNALATHDLEGALYRTALGQDIYTQDSIKDGHYHHLDVINKVRNSG